MRAAFTAVLCLVFFGCTSAPPPSTRPAKESDVMAGMGVFMLALAAKDQDSGARKMLEVKISPGAFEVLNAIAAHRRHDGRWPAKEEVPLPATITDITLVDTGSLDITMKAGEKIALSCRMSPDGTIVLYPAFAELAEAIGSSLRSR